MKRVLGIGNALVDIITSIDDDNILKKFDLPKGSMQLVDTKKSEIIKAGTKQLRRVFTSGGSSANTIHGLAMLGLNAGFIGSAGNDDTGDFFETDMKNAGVNTILFRRSSVSGTSVVFISPDSERTMATHLGAATELNAADLKKEFFNGYDILYLEGYLINNLSLVETACKMAKKSKMLVALDLASYNVVEANLQQFETVVRKFVDILFANELEAKVFTGLVPEKALALMSDSSEIAVLKVGYEGSWIKRGEEIIKISSLPVNCYDTTGAGDLYAAGFLYGFANDLNLEKCGLIGTIMAGKVIETTGSRMDKLKFKEIKKSIRKIISEN